MLSRTSRFAFGSAAVAVVSLAALPAAHAGAPTVSFSSFGPNDSYLYGDGHVVSAVGDQSGIKQGMQFTATDTVLAVNTLDVAMLGTDPGR